MGCCKEESAEVKTDLKNEGKELNINEVSYNKEAQAKVDKKPSLNKSKTNADEFDFDTYKYTIIKLHNEIREKHKSPSLEENENLSNMASIYAESLVNNQEKGNYELLMYKDEIVGENIIISESKRPEDAFKKILDEKNNYDFNSNKFSKASGHFTQAIWKDTTDIGCGFWADKTSKKNFIVLLYYPAGNVLGNFNKNVNKEKK